MTEDELRRLAEQIRAELPGLIADADERTAVDNALGRALAQPAGDAGPALADALRSHSAVRDRLEADAIRFPGQSGDPTEPIGVLFFCPNKDYSVVRDVPADEALLCPNDGAVLQRFTGQAAG
jgi:hypothetical protein